MINLNPALTIETLSMQLDNFTTSYLLTHPRVGIGQLSLNRDRNNAIALKTYLQRIHGLQHYEVYQMFMYVLNNHVTKYQSGFTKGLLNLLVVQINDPRVMFGIEYMRPNDESVVMAIGNIIRSLA